MGNVLDPVDAAAGLFVKHRHLRALVVPRRDGGSSGPGGAPTEPPLTHPDAAGVFEGLLAAARPTLELALRHGGAAEDLVEVASRPELGDPGLRTPRQAAIAAAAVLYDAPRGVDPEGFADAWVAARGLPFAAQAAVELAGLAICVLHRSNDTPALRRTDRGHIFVGQDERFAVAARVRRHLVTASDAEHAATHQAVEAMSGLTHEQSAAATFLFPERTDHVDRELKRLRGRNESRGLAVWFAIATVTTGDQALELAHAIWVDALRQSAAATATLFATVGTDLVPALVHWVDETWDAEEKLRLQRLLAGLDSDEALRVQLGMLETRGAVGVLLDAAARFPERGVRLLAEEMPALPVPRAAVERVLRLHVAACPEVARTVLPGLGAEAAARVEKLLVATEKVPAAEPGALPGLLVSPPWEQQREAVKPIVVKDLTAPAENEVVWRDDEERERWRADVLRHPRRDDENWDRLLREVRNRRRWYTLGLLIVRGPEEAARTALSLAGEGHTWDALEWLRPAVARFGGAALPAVLNATRADPAANAEAILPFASSEVALVAADWNARLKTVRPVAQTWLRRHPGVAARALIPVALGKAGKARQAAEAALRLVAAAGSEAEAEVRAAAAGYGPAAEAGIARLLSVDPLFAALPGGSKAAGPKAAHGMPELPTWAEPQSLPQLLLRGRDLALPPEATRNVVRMLTISVPDAPYPGLETVRELCDARSLAAFAWALFENWQAAGYPAKQSYGFNALRWFGDDEVVRRLSPLIRQWPGEGGHARAVAGLDVLAAIGGDTALLHLYGISQKVKFKGLKETAQRRIAAIAEELRLTQEQLADRLVPDLGLDDTGALTLDYGPRRFTVFFDEQLKPGVVDEAGKRLKALPKPGAKDDAELAPAAYQRFAGLKKDVRTLAADQIARLELAMVTRRRWTRAEFEEFLVGHPLLRHLVARLVWADFGDDGELRTAFRVAEDLSYADVDDEPCALPAGAAIGVAHPVDLAADLPRWSEVFADYEILQPFEQLGRSVFRLTPEEAAATALHRFDGAKTNSGRVLSMERRGWRRSDPADAGWQGHLLRELPDGRTVVVDLDPGFSVGWINPAEDQHFRAVWIGGPGDGYYGYWRPAGKAALPFSVLDPVSLSELVRDLTEVTVR